MGKSRSSKRSEGRQDAGKLGVVRSIEIQGPTLDKVGPVRRQAAAADAQRRRAERRAAA